MSGPNGGRKARRVVVENVNHPGLTTVVDAERYAAVRRAMMAALPDAPPGLTFGELSEALSAKLPEELFPQAAKVRWWAKTVQLDLEAKRFIARDDSRPLRWYRRSDPGPERSSGDAGVDS